MGYPNFAGRYAAMQVNTADRIELLLLLYEGAIKELKQAVLCLESGNIEERVRHINKACAIICLTSTIFPTGRQLFFPLPHGLNFGFSGLGWLRSEGEARTQRPPQPGRTRYPSLSLSLSRRFLAASIR